MNTIARAASRPPSPASGRTRCASRPRRSRPRGRPRSKPIGQTAEALAYLDLRSNRLIALPDSMANLTSLEKLDLRWNKLRALPDWLHRLEQRGCTVFV